VGLGDKGELGLLVGGDVFGVLPQRPWAFFNDFEPAGQVAFWHMLTAARSTA